MATEEDYLVVRNITQYFLVPIICVIGFAGNAVSILVLTRKRMRCSTNIYLTGLAVADILYLILLFILSLEHYKPIKYIKLFWQCRGILQWLIDASSYISLYIVVCFTIERYIAVCYPMKGHIFCTIERAKKVLSFLVLIIVFSIMSSAFEYQLDSMYVYLNETTGEQCEFLDTLDNETELDLGITSVVTTSIPLLSSSTLSSFNTATDIPNNYQNSSLQSFTNESILATSTTGSIIVSSTPSSKVYVNGCLQIIKYRVIESELATSKTYRDIFDIFTIVFYSIIPLILIIIFNTFLIRAVQQSNRLRNKMTNMSVRQIKHQQQENKITIILIAVVVLFIVCQTPWAIYIFLNTFTENILTDIYTKRICGNIFNTLVAIDAASNFILYCVLSDKYRKTLKELLMGYRHKRQDTFSNLSRQDTLASSWYSYRYKSSVKKNPTDSNNDNNNLKTENEGKPIKLTTEMIQKSKSSPSQLLHNNNNNVNNKNNNNNTDRKNIVTASTSAGVISSSFRHKSSSDSNNKRLLRPTVSFHNHPISLPSSAKSLECNSLLKQIQQQQQQQQPITTIPSDTDNKQDNILSVELNINRPRQDSNASSSSTHEENGSNNVKNNINNFLKPSDSSSSLTRSQSVILQPKTKHSPDCPSFNM